MASDRYGILPSPYWTGRTGREIQAKGSAAVILGAYLGSTHHANMIGLYPLPLLYAAADLPVLDGIDGVQYALDCLAEVDFAHYDAAASMVWAVEMARVRCGLSRTARLPVDDKRHAAILRLYRAAQSSSLAARFHDRYAVQLTLDGRGIDAPSQPLGSPLSGKPLGSPLVAPPKPVISDQGSEELKNDGAKAQPVENAQQPLRAVHSHTRTTAENGKPNVRQLAAMIRSDVLPLRLHRDDLHEAAKERAARLHLPYTSATIERAIASAKKQTTLKRKEA